MSSTDRSQTERIRRLRGQIQAVRRAECAACPELGPQGPTDQSTWLSRRVGQAPYRREAANGAIQTLSCCATEPVSVFACDPSSINFDDVIAFLKTQIPDPKTVTVTFTTDGVTISNFVADVNGASQPPIEKPIVYIQSDTSISLPDSTTYFHVNNSANIINVIYPYNGNFFPIELGPCGAL